MRKRSRKKRKSPIIFFVIIIIIVLLISTYIIYNLKEQKIENMHENKIAEIKKHYAKNVIMNKLTDLYEKDNDKYIKTSMIQKDEIVSLEEKEDFNYTDEYFKITTFDKDYYVYYKDVDATDITPKYSERYKSYIPFNKNITTKEEISLYDENENLIYKFKNKLDLPIIINNTDLYGVEYNNRLLYIMPSDIENIYDNNNGEKKNTPGIAVLNYHFFYDANDPSDASSCNQIICLSTTRLKKHLDYIKNNNIFTPTMKELEMYIDGVLQLPKSVVLTIDDGWRADIGSNIMNDYGINATVFIVSNDYDPNPYEKEYIEVHSHSHSLHTPGACPGGQGGGIKCLEKSKLLEDLAASRAKLHNTTIFCYPFYEYNNYSIEVLKEAGFTMAFGGYGENGIYKVKPGANKYKLPRYIIYSNTTEKDIASYIG